MNELGMILFKASLAVDLTAELHYHRPRPVPFAMKLAIEEELSRLERVGVLERVNHSDWATPIVSVPKKNGCVCVVTIRCP